MKAGLHEETQSIFSVQIRVIRASVVNISFTSPQH